MNKKLALLSMLLLGAAACRDAETAQVNGFLTNIRGTWQLAEVNEYRLPNNTTPSRASFPKVLKLTFDECAYRGSGNNCFATLQFDNANPLEIKFRVNNVGNAIAFEGYENLGLSSRDSLFLSGSWGFRNLSDQTVMVEQRTYAPYFNALLKRR